MAVERRQWLAHAHHLLPITERPQQPFEGGRAFQHHAGASVGKDLEEYGYLGLDTIVVRTSPEPGIALMYAKVGNEQDNDGSGTGGGDQYTGLDRFGRVVDQRWVKTSDNSAIDRYQYGYDENSNRIWKDNLATTGKDEYYTYDMLNRLSTFDRGDLNANKTGVDNLARYQTWALDPLGNWSTFDNNGSTQTRTHNGQNQIATISGATNPAYDNNGNTITDETNKTFTYDAWNRLASKSSSPLHYYQYDALGRLTREGELYWLMSDMYYNDRWQVVEDQRVQCRVGMIKSQYVWSVGFVDDMLLRDRNVDMAMNTGSYGKSSSGLEERTYALNDANYNTTALVSAAGSVVERLIEDPYGSATFLNPSTWAALTGSNYAWVHTHQGAWLDASSGLLYYRNRMYSPTLGRWMQQDPLGYVDGMSLYELVRSNPTRYTDCLGLAREGQIRGGTYEVRVEPYGKTPGLSDAQEELVSLAGDVETLDTILDWISRGGVGLAGWFESRAIGVIKNVLEEIISNRLDDITKPDAEKLARAAKRFSDRMGNRTGFQLFTRIRYEQFTCRSNFGFKWGGSWKTRYTDWKVATKARGAIDVENEQVGVTFEDPFRAFRIGKEKGEEHLEEWKEANADKFKD